MLDVPTVSALPAAHTVELSISGMRRIAKAIRDNPAIVLENTISQIADACGTSVASVVRFCRAVGASGYAELLMVLFGWEKALGGYDEELAWWETESVRAAALLS